MMVRQLRNRSKIASESRTLLLRSILFTGLLAIFFGRALVNPGLSGAATIPLSTEETQPNCSGDKNQSLLKVKFGVLNGRIRVDKERSRGGFEPSELFKCRGLLSNNQSRRQRFEKELIDDLDGAFLLLRRFYLQSIPKEDLARLVTHLPPGARDEFVPFLSSSQRVKLFVYLANEDQLQVISKLDRDQKKEFFAYLPPEVQEEVLKGLPEAEQTALKAKQKQEPPLTAAPPNETQRLAVAGFPATDKETKNPGSWQDFLRVYETWRKSGSEAGPVMIDALDSFLTHNLSPTALRNSSIFGYDSTDNVVDATNGELILRVTDPIGALMNEDDYRVLVPDHVEGITDSEYITVNKEKIFSLLRPLKGQLWKRQRIATYINDYFIRDRTGYERDDLDVLDGPGNNSLSVSPAEVEPKCIVVPPVPQIARVAFLGEVERTDIKLALREVLTDRELNVYRKNPSFIAKCEDQTRPVNVVPGPESGAEVTIKCERVRFQDLIRANDHLPYFNRRNWLVQQTALAQAGFKSIIRPYSPKATEDTADESAEESDDGDDGDCDISPPSFVEIRITKGGTDESLIQKPKPSPSPSPVAAPSPESSPTSSPSTFAAPPQPSPVPASNGAQKPSIQKPKRNSVGAELVYRPDQGVRVYAQYKRLRPGQDDFSIRVGGDGGLLVSGDYETNDLFFGRFERRFPFVARSYSDSIASRIFNTQKMDERRSGAALRVATDIRREPTLFSLSFEARHETVALADDVAVVTKQNVSSLSFGATYSAASKGARFRRQWQFEPLLRFGLGVSNQPSFSVWQLNGRLHQYLPNRFDLILDGRIDLASKDTPLFEQPSFGSSDTVRGFRADDAIGRRQWALKNEFVMPVPGTSPDSSGLLGTIRDRMQLAGFIDVGGIYQTTGSKPGVRVGPGVGIRFNYQGMNLQLDWAYGLGDASVGRGRGRFYFSVSREISRLIRQ
jgi:Haemolysin secretion/activation protein ShlB/FhaC/HecB/MgtE intracellular N domain